MYDILFRGGLIVDGSGEKAFIGDLAVKDGIIAEIAAHIDGPAQKTIDATGLVVSPGFIDFHSHSDTTFLYDDRCQSKLYQGVTSEVAGQCGSTPFPNHPNNDNPKSAAAFFAPSMAEYIENCRKAGKGMSTNLMLLVGHGDLRTFVMGPENRAANPQELEQMRQILDRDMADGAWGLSLGLGYAPGVSSDQNELNLLGEIVARHDGLITSHMRNQSERTPEAMEEMFNIYRHCGARVHIAHFKAYDKENWGRAPEFADILHKAQADGIKASADVYPYNAAASGVTNAWPNWAIRGGSGEAVARATVGHPDYPRLLKDMGDIFATPEDGDSLYIVTTHGMMPEADGKTIRQIAQETGMTMAEAQLEVTRRTKAGADCILFGMSQDDVLHFMAQEDIVIGSDGSGFPLDPALVDGKPHPRNFGTFPRYLRMCRQHELCDLETAVHRITGRGAQLLGLKNRGLLRQGAVADITVFNPETISDQATFDEPVQPNIGIEHVVLAGRFALENGQQTDLRGGEFLLKNK